MVVKSKGRLPHVGKFSHTFTVNIVDKFRLTLEADAACLAGAHAATLQCLMPEIEFDVHRLLATAALRHVGTPYLPSGSATRQAFDIATAKETALWWSWLDVTSNGTLLMKNARNSGRLIEVASSLGEAIALDLAVACFGTPLKHWRRVPEQSGAMDFIASSPRHRCEIAVEAKAGHGSVVGKNLTQIAPQKAASTAHEKYGSILCYQMSGRAQLKKKGSYLRLVDPPGADGPMLPIDTAIAMHYRDVAQNLELWELHEFLEQYLAIPARGPSRPNDVSSTSWRDEFRSRAAVAVQGHAYVGRWLSLDGISEDPLEECPELVLLGTSWRCFFGLSQRVIDLLLTLQFEEIETLEQGLTFSIGELGHQRLQFVSGMGNGILRIDRVGDWHDATAVTHL